MNIFAFQGLACCQVVLAFSLQKCAVVNRISATLPIRQPLIYGNRFPMQMYRKISRPFSTPSFKESVQDSSDIGSSISDANVLNPQQDPLARQERHVAIIGAGWGGLSAAHALVRSTMASPSHHDMNTNFQHEHSRLRITVVDAAPRVGGLVRDGYKTMMIGNQQEQMHRQPASSTGRVAEAGQHGFWSNYVNIFQLLENEIDGLDINQVLTGYSEQGQYSPSGLEAIWPVYRDQPVSLPTGLAQAAYTRFLKLPWWDRVTALPLVLAFSEFDDSDEAWKLYDAVSFRDLCIRLGVSRRCYEEAFEPMILTGLFAPGAECSAAAALGMAYFFVLQSQKAFDVRWCRGNIGSVLLDPWIKSMQKSGHIDFMCSTRVTGFNVDPETKRIVSVQCQQACDDKDKEDVTLQVDHVIMAVGAQALNAFVRTCPELAELAEFRGFANLRGTSVLATRLYLNRTVPIPYSANACWGFDAGVGMTVFDIRTLHGYSDNDAPGSVLEVDYYHASSLLFMSDDAIVAKVKRDLDTILGACCETASVLDAAVVRLPQAVNWYFPGSYRFMPSVKSRDISNLCFAGDIVRTRHGSWSQEKAFVTGREAANVVLNRPLQEGILPLPRDEAHVKLGKDFVRFVKTLLGAGQQWMGPSLVDFLI